MIAFIATLILLYSTLALVEGRVEQRHVTGIAGESVHLPCQVDELRCGHVHNIQWYRGQGDTRVYIYSELAGVEIDENMLMGRGFFHYDKSSSTTSLEIRPLLPEDESLYKCELTYLDVRDSCSVIQFVNLTTTARPETISIQLEDGSLVDSGSVVGPLVEGASMALRCETSGAKPAAQLTWWKNTVNMGGENSVVIQNDGTSLSSNILHHKLTRSDLGATFECQAINHAMDRPLRASIKLDLHVRPSSVQISGLTGAVNEGDDVILTCRIVGAKPAATATWYHSGKLVDQPTRNRVIQQSDGTMVTVSEYRWKAGREDNGKNIVCAAKNVISIDSRQPPISDSVQPNVLYAPIVRALPDLVTVNETMDILIFCSSDANPSNLSRVRWFKDGESINPGRPVGERVDGGSQSVQSSLFIANSSVLDSGVYSCRAENSVGWSPDTASAVVFVLRAPQVTIDLYPNKAYEDQKQNITLQCNIAEISLRESEAMNRRFSEKNGVGGTSGRNLMALRRVRWYRNDHVIKETIACNQQTSEYEHSRSYDGPCSENVNTIVLPSVDRNFNANYSCRGENGGGWGGRSSANLLTIYYSPGGASIQHDPPVVIKGSPLVLHCRLDEPGHPKANKFTWMRGSRVVTDANTATWRIPVVTSQFNTNISCVAKNRAGASDETTLPLSVLARPRFIQPLPAFLSVPANQTSVELTCRVECSPACTISWHRNNQPISNNGEYSIKSHRLPIDISEDHLQSTVSALLWHLDTRSLGGRGGPEPVFSCVASGNSVGRPVESSTRYTPRYKPHTVKISPATAMVREGADRMKLHCTSLAYPAADYVWERNGAVISREATLLLRPSAGGISRDHEGQYTCRAVNSEGAASATTYVTVKYIPTCRVRQMDTDKKIALLCEAVSNSNDRNLEFSWHIANNSMTSQTVGLNNYVAPESSTNHNTAVQILRVSENSSQLLLPSGGDIFVSSVQCTVTNSVGKSRPCILSPSEEGGWLAVISSAGGVTLTAVASAALVFLVIISLVIYVCFCRQRIKHKYFGRNSRKYKESKNSDGSEATATSTSARQNSATLNASNGDINDAKSAQKWPNRPGVRVHSGISRSHLESTTDTENMQIHEMKKRGTENNDAATTGKELKQGASNYHGFHGYRSVESHYENLTIGESSSDQDKLGKSRLVCARRLNFTSNNRIPTVPDATNQDVCSAANNNNNRVCSPATSGVGEEQLNLNSSSPSEMSWNGSSGYASTTWSQQNDTCPEKSYQKKPPIDQATAAELQTGRLDCKNVMKERNANENGNSTKIVPHHSTSRYLPEGSDLGMVSGLRRSCLRPSHPNLKTSESTNIGQKKQNDNSILTSSCFDQPSQSVNCRPQLHKNTETSNDGSYTASGHDKSRTQMGSIHKTEFSKANSQLYCTSSMPRKSLTNRGFYNCQTRSPLTRAGSHDHPLRMHSCRRLDGLALDQHRKLNSYSSVLHSNQWRAASPALLRSNSQSGTTLSDVSQPRPPIRVNRYLHNIQHMRDSSIERNSSSSNSENYSQVQKQYVPNHYATLQLPGVSQEINV